MPDLYTTTNSRCIRTLWSPDDHPGRQTTSQNGSTIYRADAMSTLLQVVGAYVHCHFDMAKNDHPFGMPLWLYTTCQDGRPGGSNLYTEPAYTARTAGH